MVILILLMITATAYYMAAVFFLYRGLCANLSSGEPQHLTFSVIIAARNEERHIAACLDAVLKQSIAHDRYEVMVIDDRSTDATPIVLKDYALRYPSLSIITIVETHGSIAPKKYAILQGVERAKNQIIVTTDADCRVPETWLHTIDCNFGAGTGLVQGITTYEKPAGMNAFFFRLQAIDFLSHGVVAAAAIGASLPINSNANNFAYRKQAFQEVGGYGSASGVVSGDDDLLVQRISRSGVWLVRFMIDPLGAVTTAPTTTIRGAFEQRKRWGSKTVHYNRGQMLFLGGIFLFYLLIVIGLFSGIMHPALALVAAGMLLMKVAGECLLMMKGTSLFNHKELRSFIIPASIIQLPLVILAVAGGVFGKFNWKGQAFTRSVKPH